jgi:cytochrome b561
MNEKYTKGAVVLHWLVAIGIIVNLWIGLRFDYTPKDSLRDAINFHKSVGITVLGLALLRVLWRVSHVPLYGMIVLVPLSGWLHDSAWKDAGSHPMSLFGVVPWFRLPIVNGLSDAQKDHWHDLLGGLHTATAYILLAAVALHILGALKHQFLDKHRELQRMWF